MAIRDIHCDCCGRFVPAVWHSAKYCRICAPFIKRMRQRQYTLGYQRARRKYDPDYAEQHRQAMREKRASDPDFHERQLEAARRYRRQRLKTDSPFAAAEQARFERMRARSRN